MGKLCHIHPIIITIVFHKGGIHFFSCPLLMFVVAAVCWYSPYCIVYGLFGALPLVHSFYSFIAPCGMAINLLEYYSKVLRAMFFLWMFFQLQPFYQYREWDELFALTTQLLWDRPDVLLMVKPFRYYGLMMRWTVSVCCSRYFWIQLCV